MGLKRMIWRSTGAGLVIDTVKNIKEEGAIGSGLKRVVKENICEDNPITSRIYKIVHKGTRQREASGQIEEKTYSEEIAKAISQFLEKDDWEYFWDEENGVFSFGLKINKEIKTIDYLILVNKDSYTVNGYVTVGGNADDPEMMAELAEFICRANSGLLCGNFELDYVDGTVTYKTYTYCEDMTVSQANISHSIFTIVGMFQKYGKGILDVISGKLSALDAIDECEEKEE